MSCFTINMNSREVFNSEVTKRNIKVTAEKVQAKVAPVIWNFRQYMAEKIVSLGLIVSPQSASIRPCK